MLECGVGRLVNTSFSRSFSLCAINFCLRRKAIIIPTIRHIIMKAKIQTADNVMMRFLLSLSSSSLAPGMMIGLFVLVVFSLMIISA